MVLWGAIIGSLLSMDVSWGGTSKGDVIRPLRDNVGRKVVWRKFINFVATLSFVILGTV